MLAQRIDTEFSIPQEVSDITISFLKADPVSLKNCSLVCRSWLLSSRYHLFQTVELDHNNIEKFSSLVAETQSTIPFFVRRLKLAPGSRQDHRLFRRILPLLHFFKSVTWIALENLDWTCIKRPLRSKFFYSVKASLTELELKNLEFPTFRDVVEVVCESSSLITVSLTDISWATGSLPVPLRSPVSNQSFSRLPELKCPNLEKLIIRNCQIRPIFSWLLSHSSIPAIPSLEVGPIHERDTMLFGRYFRYVGRELLHLRMSFRTGGVDHACYSDSRPNPNDPSSTDPLAETHSSNSKFIDEDQLDLEAAQKLYGPIEDELCHLQGTTICDNLANLTGLRTLYLEDFISHTDVDRSSATVWAPRVILSMKSLHLHTLVLDISLSRAGEVDAHPINWHLFDRILTEGRKERLKRVEVKYGGSIKHDPVKQLISSRWPVCQSMGKLHFISKERPEAAGRSRDSG